MVPFYLRNKTKKRIEMFFSLLTKEEYECLTNKETIDIKASMLEISEALTARHFFNGTAKKKFQIEIETSRRENLYLKNRKDKKALAKWCLINVGFNFKNRNITINEALEIVGEEGEIFKDKNPIWKNYSSEDIILFLKTKLNNGFSPLTDNKRVFRHELKEFLEGQSYTEPRVIDLCIEIAEKIFIRYEYKPKKHSLSVDKVLKGVRNVFTDEEINFLRDENGVGIIEYFLSRSSDFTPVYKTVKESKLALEKALTAIRKDNGMVYSRRETIFNFYGFFMYALFYPE